MTTLASRLQFMESQAAYIESRSRMIQHGTIQYPSLVGIERSASPFADTVTYYSWDGTGDMIDLANRATDYPFVEVTQAQHNVNIEWKGLAYDYSDREIGRAMLTGVPLTDRKTRMAFRIWEEIKDDVFINGDSAKGWDGFVNYDTSGTNFITLTNAAGAWSGLTGVAIADEINMVLSSVNSGSNQVRTSDTLCLPVAQRNLIATKPIGDNADKSVLAYIKENNIYTQETGNPLMIRTLRQLENAGGTMGSPTDRMIAYSRDMDVLRFHVPQELQFLEPQRRADTWIYYGHGVLAGLEIMEPGAMKYHDDI